MPEKSGSASTVDEPEGMGRVYLCQVGGRISCGACCGLYNVAGLSQSSLEAMLARRADEFSRVPRSVEAIDGFQRRIEGFSQPKRPFPDFHHCPFLGMIGENGGRPGCLLHPQAPGNDGRDWRGLSYYGGMACRTYFCPSTRLLPEACLRIVHQTLDHWYLYGLMVTERGLLAAFFREVESRIGRPVEPDDFLATTEAAALFREFAGLKLSWAYRREDAPGPCNYFFENGEYPRPSVHGSGGNVAASPYEGIYRELESGFSSGKDLQAAEALLDHLFGRLGAAIIRAGR